MNLSISPAAVTGNKSRSIHNLTGGAAVSGHMASASELRDQGFYQNLSIYRGQNISQPNLGQPMSPQHQQQQMQQQPQHHHQMNQPSNRPVSAYYPNATPGSGGGGPGGPVGYQMMGDPQQQTSYSNEALQNPNQQLQQQQPMMRGQMMAPSMPNIAHSSGYASNIPASQSMHNVNQAQNYPVHYQPQFQGGGGGPQQQQQQQSNQLRGQAKLAEMGELLKRRQQQQQQGSQLDIQTAIGPNGQSMSPMMMSPNHQQKTILGQGMPMSPLRQLPPTAPKPTVCGIVMFHETL